MLCLSYNIFSRRLARSHFSSLPLCPSFASLSHFRTFCSVFPMRHWLQLCFYPSRCGPIAPRAQIYWKLRKIGCRAVEKNYVSRFVSALGFHYLWLCLRQDAPRHSQILKYLSLLSAFTIFDFILDRMRLGIDKSEKLRFSICLCSRLSLSLISS